MRAVRGAKIEIGALKAGASELTMGTTPKVPTKQ
jgi:hypothetical protein